MNRFLEETDDLDPIQDFVKSEIEDDCLEGNFDTYNVAPIRLSNAEQVALALDVVKINKNIVLMSKAYLLSKKPEDYTKKEANWFKKQTPDDIKKMQEFSLMAERDFKNLHFNLLEEENRLFTKLWASIVLMAYKELSRSYAVLFRNPATRPTIIMNTMAEVLNALPNYKPEKAAFNTFIVPYLRQGGYKTSADENNTTTRYNRIRKEIMEAVEVIQKKDQEPTVFLIAEITGESLETINAILEREDIKNNSISIDAFDKGSEAFSNENQSEGIIAQSSYSPENAYEQKEFDEAIQRTLKNALDKQSETIVELKHGIINGRDLSDTEIAKILNITPAEVTSRYNTAIRQLRRYIEKKEPILNDVSVKESRDNYDRVLHFAPISVSKTDMEDAISFMDSVSFAD